MTSVRTVENRTFNEIRIGESASLSKTITREDIEESELEMPISLKTVTTVGLTIPPFLLTSADEVIN